MSADPEHPESLTWASRLIAALVALGAVVVLLVVLLHDQLIRNWAQGRSDMRKVLRTQGLQAVKDSEVHVPAFIPVALTLFVVMALLVWVLTMFLRAGYGWARIALTVTLFFLAVGTIAGLRTGAPLTFTILSVLSFPIEASAAYFMWHQDTSTYLKQVADDA